MAVDRPKTDRIRDCLMGNILQGKYREGEKLPSLRQLAKEHNVSYLTAHMALNELRNLGFVEVRAASGAYVLHRHQAAEPGNNHLNIGLAYLDFYSTYVDQQECTHPTLIQWFRGFHDYFPGNRATLKPICYSKFKLADPGNPVSQALERKELDGLIITGWLTAAEADFLTERRIPFVLVDHELPEREVPTVNVNRPFAFKLLARHMIETGRSKIKFITYSTDQEIHYHRGLPYIRAAHSVGLTDFSQDDIVIIANDDIRLGVDYLKGVTTALADEPQGLIVRDDVLATRLLAECLKRKLSVPEDLSFAAMVDSLPGHHILKLTTTNLFTLVREEVGIACELIDRAIKGQDIRRESIAVTPTLISGETTLPAGRTKMHSASAGPGPLPVLPSPGSRDVIKTV